ncbi:hypothetical protein JOC78_003117 [Bacillus ectoiniformans]|uniref:hypothetical protein n=1 Tax=Bacillus ectoiniformans TaxID=1494429 RepID=UPI0019598159|nr:hypothetical protein [Bacillus ectoiniformans]MBM7650133.1 hypothetical protein [Bacillus ectoiniformans]
MENSFHQVNASKLFKKYASFFTITSCSILLFVSIGLYMNYKEKQYYAAYADKMIRINHLMQGNIDKAHTIIQSYSLNDPLTEKVQVGEGVVAGSMSSYNDLKNNGTIDEVLLDSETCNKLLIELNDPPEELIKPYLQLLDVHIIYKEYLHLATQPSKDPSTLSSKEKALKTELEERMQSFETLINPT